MLLLSSSLKALPPDEGMWLPMFIQRLNYADMKKKGLKLKPEEIYSINHSSLKDAIVMLSGGMCTAEVVSPQGLLLTNHHCAYDAIQSHSSLSADYLTNGFWAKTLADELPNEGMTASFLVRMEDVTKQVLADISPDMSEDERNQKINQLKGDIEAKASEEGRFEAVVKPFFEGNEYYLFVYETFRDVRLVGAPPEAIGKFGGDTDNWMWPRHTGDFAMLRVYTAPDGSPADYAKENVPLKPRHHLPVSLDGLKRGDFTMVMGYPGSTNRYMTSFGIEEQISVINPLRIRVRTKRLDLMREDMQADPAIRLKYASKYATVSNYWKYFQGQNQGVERLDVLERKRQLENRFTNWVNADPARKKKYGQALDLLQQGYEQRTGTNVFYYHLQESFFGSEIVNYAYGFSALRAALRAPEPDPAHVEEEAAALREDLQEYFENYEVETDKKISAALFEMFASEVEDEMKPDIFEEVENSYGGDFTRFVDDLFGQSMFASEEKVRAFLDDPIGQKESLLNDPVFDAIVSVLQTYFRQVMPIRQEAGKLINRGNRLFVAGLREMMPEHKFYPDANSSMRLTYGQVLDYFPADAKLYSYYTTASGILEKEDPDNPEFVVPARLKSLIEARDFGRYAYNGRLRVGFITNNDITGGNSGSPVINGKGQLVGIAFDGNWEAMSGDLAFEPRLQRCINVDIRYVLFVIDKYGGAGHLIDEMTLIDGRDRPAKEFEKVMLEKY